MSLPLLARRHARIAAALSLLVFISLLFVRVLYSSTDHLYLLSMSARNCYRKKPAVNLSDFPPLRPNPSSGTKPELVKDAHTLPTADSFLPHFKAVTQMRGMTMQEAKSGCNWPALDAVNFQYPSDTEWAKQDRSDEELEARRNQWHNFINNDLLPYESYKDRFHGRGIVIVAGNGRTMKRVKVVLRALRKYGSQLPVEIHYWDKELPEELKKNISSLWPEIYFNDLSAPTNIVKADYNVFMVNYQLKTAAMINSRFAEPLLLDSDNIPTMDPESLYESSIYKEYNSLFWPDIARTRPNNPMWPITNTPCRMDEYEQESGQLIVNKHKFFYHLQLAGWFNNNHSEYYNAFLLGDKDMFRFAWHALQTKYGVPPKWLTSVGTLTNGFYCGHSFAQHHPNGSVAFLHGGLVKTMAKEVLKWQRETQGGIFQAYKRAQSDEQHVISVDVGIKWDPADYLPNKPADIKVAMCTDMYKVSSRPLDEIIPGFEKIFEEIGGYWMLDE